MEVTSTLGAFAAGLKIGDIPKDVQERARLFMLDGLAIMFGAADFAKRNQDTMLKNYLEQAAPPGKATVIGYGIQTTPMMAAFANGTMMEVLDYQDSNMKTSMHAGPGVIPSALALSETNPYVWEDIVPAIVAGYEVHTRLMTTIQPSHWESGFQATGTFGTCGSATTAGRLFNFSPQQMAAALGIAGFIMPVSNGDNQFKGYSVKPVHGGQASTCGISSAYMARAGYQGGPLEGEPPRYHASLQIMSDGPKLERALQGIGEYWHSLDFFLKPYPVGGLIIGKVEIILDLLKERKINADDIKSIDVVSYKHAVMYTGKKYTTTESNFVDAHLSIPYCIAVALIDGEMTVNQLSKERLKDPKVHQLASRVTVTEDLNMTKQYPDLWPVDIAINMNDGSVIKRFIDKVKWSPHRPPTWDEIAEKFHLMVDPVLGKDRAQNSIDLCAGLKAGNTLGPLMASLQTN